MIDPSTQLALPLVRADGVRYTAVELARLLRLHPPTDEQAEVIEAPLEPGVIVAGAGSGKTETMAARVVWLVANGMVAPEQVLGLTFTRKAARELSARIRHRLSQLRARGHVSLESDGDAPPGEVSVATYDAYAQRIVSEHALRLGREPGARLVTPATAWQYATRVAETYDGPMDAVESAFSTVVNAILALHGEMSGHLVSAEQVADHTARLVAEVSTKPPVARTKKPMYSDVREALARQQARLQLLPLVRAFAAEKRRREAVDFADQAALAAELAERFPEVGQRERERYPVVLLDEYQDTSHAQLAMLRGLFGGRTGHPVTAVGDPCQSIYGWRGASAATLTAFGSHFRTASGKLAPTRSLTMSFRNGASILEVANVLAAPLRQGGLDVRELAAHPSNARGKVVVALHHTVEDEAADVAARARAVWDADAANRARGKPGRTVAVLVRRRSQIDRLAHSLRTAGLPVEVVGVGGLLATPAVSDVVATLRVLADPGRGDALMRLLTGARWRIGPRDLDALGRWARRLAATRAPRPDGGSGPDERNDAGRAPAAPDVTAPAERHPGDPEGGEPEPDEVDDASIIDALDAVEAAPVADFFSAEGRRRLTLVAQELRALRRRAAQPLVDLVADVVRTLGLDVEIAARTGDIAVSRADIDAFLDVAVAFAESGEGVSLSAFLSYLDAADAEERGLEPGQVEVAEERVQVLTVHGAKGLEWDVVFVPGLVENIFPAAGQKDRAWLTDLGALPFPLRGDREALPVLDFAGAADQKEVKEAFDRFVEECGDRARIEERRLAYVATTRARQLLVCSGYRWDETQRPREPGEYLLEIADACRGGAGRVGIWHGEVDVAGGNPLTAEPPRHAWPYDPLTPERRTELEAGAALVEYAKAALAAEQSPAPAVLEAAAYWQRDVDLLLAERARRTSRHDVVVALPDRLSVSQLVQLRREPDALARAIRRPVPRPPNPLARRGTAFHAWLESRYGRPQLLDIDELPGSADAQAAPDDDLAALQEAFLASEWADRQPVEVEVSFELLVAGVVVRGRADAVFPASPGGEPGVASTGDPSEPPMGIVGGTRVSAIEVVDWKTGRPPRDPEEEATRAVQLAAYRLAWARLSGLPLDRVHAAFHYVRQNVTIRPVDLLDAEGLEALITAVPEESDGPDGPGPQEPPA
ncbi:ATP-dependent DNA helicase [Actinopolymorpha pittospori]|uniref:DNA 3'-5' helicase n=1 Tax=Actinopolymorpha pittospori TaxID=648752 RepID=A0A927N7P1_9ACTN|nr:ATP-dependent DNA helicase [Actinopolymorpha pittospori]MBE1611743.1 DNA helicase-2/ATP-dependent DNA helicase PcrA [Actinopolymorpha pittospori]